MYTPSVTLVDMIRIASDGFELRRRTVRVEIGQCRVIRQTDIGPEPRRLMPLIIINLFFDVKSKTTLSRRQKCRFTP